MPSNVELVKGWFENTLPPWAEAHKGETIAFLHVDCDIYSSTVTILRTLQPLLRPGSLIVFDDMYGYVGWDEHEAKALYEFLRVSNFRLLGVGKTGPARRYSDKALGDVGEAQQSYPLQPAAYIVW